MKMKLLRNFFLHAGLACLLTTAALAQTTAFSYQGRLTEGGALANGLYDFRLSAHDAAAVGNQVGATLPFDDVLVTNGLFVLYPDFGGGVLNGQPRWIEVNVRPGASTGTYTTLNPRQPVVATPVANVANTVLSLPAGAVGAAQLAAGTITVDKLAPAVAQGLAPSGALLAAFESDAPSLLTNGYVRVPSLSTSVGGWGEIAERNAQTNFYNSGYASVWTGTEMLVGGEGFGGAPSRFALTRFNPATGLWSPAATNNEPQFRSTSLRYVKLVQGGSDVFAIGDTDTFANTNSTGGIYNLTNGTWRNIPTNGATQIYDDGGLRVAHIFWTGSELLAAGTLGMTLEFGAALFNPVTNGWRAANTNGYDPIYPDSAILAWTGTELLVYGNSRTNFNSMAGSLFRPDTGVWRPATTNGGPSFISGPQSKKPLWTGSEVVTLILSSGPGSLTGLFAYNPVQNSWRVCSTNGMPALGGATLSNPNIFWTGTEVGMVLRTGSISPYKTVVALYSPASDVWRSFTSTDFSIANPMNATDYNVAVVPVWNNSEALAYLPTLGDGITVISKVFRFTPPRTLYFYQKP